jgi:hypothetical protein
LSNGLRRRLFSDIREKPVLLHKVNKARSGEATIEKGKGEGKGGREKERPLSLTGWSDADMNIILIPGGLFLQKGKR